MNTSGIGQVIITFLVGGGAASLVGVVLQFWRERQLKHRNPRREKVELDDQLIATAQRVTDLVRNQLEELESQLAEERKLRRELEIEVAMLRAALQKAGIPLPYP